MRVEMEHPLLGTVRLVANPISMSASPVAYRNPPPILGQHTSEVLASWLGLGEAQIAELRRCCVV